MTNPTDGKEKNNSQGVLLNWWMRNSLVGSLVTALYGSDRWITESKILSNVIRALLYVVIFGLLVVVFRIFTDA